MMLCPHCGTDLETHYLSCPKCGARINDDNSPNNSLPEPRPRGLVLIILFTGLMGIGFIFLILQMMYNHASSPEETEVGFYIFFLTYLSLGSMICVLISYMLWHKKKWGLRLSIGFYSLFSLGAAQGMWEAISKGKKPSEQLGFMLFFILILLTIYYLSKAKTRSLFR
jgi:hypothetical protein